MNWSVLELGPESTGGAERWNGDRRIRRVIRLHNPAPSGRRLGSRALGLGLDALRVALRARFSLRQTSIIAMNPWTSVAAKLVGFRDVSTVGLYAVEGGKSWRLLRRVIGSGPMVTLSEHEAGRWNAAGGRAVAVRYGATFSELPIPELASEERRPNEIRVFIGGSSDRDGTAIEALVHCLRRSNREDIRLIIAVGDGEASDDGQVRRVASIPPSEFSLLLRSCDVVYLPLADNGRAAGHMVLVEALQRGKPVVATWVAGMHEYFDGEHVIRAQANLLDQLSKVATDYRGREDDLQRYWRRHHSMEAFGSRILDAFTSLHEENVE